MAPHSSAEELVEQWDWQRERPSGKPISRKISHIKGIPHEGVHLWIIRQKEEEWEILFQRRSSTKDLYPGYLDITVGGHVPYGLKDNKIQKEAREELGISPSDSEMIDLGYFKYEEEVSEMGLFHREFQHVYLMESPMELKEYSFNDGEVSEICGVKLKDFEKVLEKKHSFTAGCFNGMEEIVVNLKNNDFHPLFFTGPMGEYISILLKSIKEYINNRQVKTTMPLIIE